MSEELLYIDRLGNPAMPKNNTFSSLSFVNQKHICGSEFPIQNFMQIGPGHG